MASPITITVTGTSTIRRIADCAVMYVSISSEGPQQAQVAEDVRKTSKLVQELCQGLAGDQGAAAVSYTTGGLSTGSFQPWSQDAEKELPRRYTANSSVDLTFNEFSKMGSMASTLSQIEFVSISSLDWRLKDKTRASLGSQSRRNAVRDAIVKAGDYAAAAGKEKVSPVEITDGASATDLEPTGVLRMSRAMRHGEGAAGDIDRGEMSFTPESVTIETSVVVKFLAE